MKLGLLITDNDENYGGEVAIRDSIEKRLRDISHGERELDIITYFVVNGKFPPTTDKFDGFIITGSHYSVNDKLSWMLQLEKFIQEIYHDSAAGPKLFGICFGHQLIAKALGGRVGRNPTDKLIWCSGSVEVTKDLASKDYYKRVFGEQNLIYIMQSHYEQVLEKPECAKNAGSAPGECEHEILMYGENILTMQGHPEVTAKRMCEVTLPILIQKNKITKDEERIAMASFEKENGDQLISLVFNFFEA